MHGLKIKTLWVRIMAINYAFVPFTTCAKEIADNVDRYVSEITDGSEHGAPNVDWETYLEMSVRGLAMVVTARDGEKLIGFIALAITHNLRHKDITEAWSQGIFIEKEYRGEVGVALTKKADEFIKSFGVNTSNFMLSDSRVGRLLERNGYQPKYTVWSKNHG